MQGVGFRPFVYRLARELGLVGWVNNSSRGVTVEVEGEREGLDVFLLRLERERPPRASIQSLEPVFLDPAGLVGFEIRRSEEGGGEAGAGAAGHRHLRGLSAGDLRSGGPAVPVSVH